MRSASARSPKRPPQRRRDEKYCNRVCAPRARLHRYREWPSRFHPRKSAVRQHKMRSPLPPKAVQALKRYAEDPATTRASPDRRDARMRRRTAPSLQSVLSPVSCAALLLAETLAEAQHERARYRAIDGVKNDREADPKRSRRRAPRQRRVRGQRSKAWRSLRIRKKICLSFLQGCRVGDRREGRAVRPSRKESRYARRVAPRAPRPHRAPTAPKTPPVAA